MVLPVEPERDPGDHDDEGGGDVDLEVENLVRGCILSAT